MSKCKHEDDKVRVGIVGATGMVGQRFITLLHEHPEFRITVLAASSRSAGKPYAEVMKDRWAMAQGIPEEVGSMVVQDAQEVQAVCDLCDFVFCAVDMDKKLILQLEEEYARAETPVVSNNSAARGLADVPMIIPEVNAAHTAVIAAQRKRLGTGHGFIAVKPNCSIQSYVPALSPLRQYGIKQVCVSTYQAISGAGKTFASWPEMVDNCIPFIGGEEPKSEQEPLKIWGEVREGSIVNAAAPVISAQCIRVAASDGHMATVSVSFERPPSEEQILQAWQSWRTEAQQLALPSAPTPFVTYFEQQDRPQTKLDRDVGGGMGVAIGRLRKDTIFDYKFVCLSHNTVRGAAGGALLMAELLYKQGYITRKSER